MTLWIRDFSSPFQREVYPNRCYLASLASFFFAFTFSALDAKFLIRLVSFWVPILLMCLPNSFLFLQIRGICTKMIHGGSSTCLFFLFFFPALGLAFLYVSEPFPYPFHPGDADTFYYYMTTKLTPTDHWFLDHELYFGVLYISSIRFSIYTLNSLPLYGMFAQHHTSFLSVHIQPTTSTLGVTKCHPKVNPQERCEGPVPASSAPSAVSACECPGTPSVCFLLSAPSSSLLYFFATFRSIS